MIGEDYGETSIYKDAKNMVYFGSLFNGISTFVQRI